jgi:hypothetical protein
MLLKMRVNCICRCTRPEQPDEDSITALHDSDELGRLR